MEKIEDIIEPNIRTRKAGLTGFMEDMHEAILGEKFIVPPMEAEYKHTDKLTVRFHAKNPKDMIKKLREVEYELTKNF